MVTSQGSKGGLSRPGSPQEVPRGSLGGGDRKGVCVVFEKLFDGFVFSMFGSGTPSRLPSLLFSRSVDEMSAIVR